MMTGVHEKASTIKNVGGGCNIKQIHTVMGVSRREAGWPIEHLYTTAAAAVQYRPVTTSAAANQ